MPAFFDNYRTAFNVYTVGQGEPLSHGFRSFSPKRTIRMKIQLRTNRTSLCVLLTEISLLTNHAASPQSDRQLTVISHLQVHMILMLVAPCFFAGNLSLAARS